MFPKTKTEYQIRAEGINEAFLLELVVKHVVYLIEYLLFVYAVEELNILYLILEIEQ